MSPTQNINLGAADIAEEEAQLACCINANKRRRQFQPGQLPDDDNPHAKQRVHLDETTKDPFSQAQTQFNNRLEAAQLLLLASQTNPQASLLYSQRPQIDDKEYCRQQIEQAVTQRLLAAQRNAYLPDDFDFLPSPITATPLPGSYQRNSISSLGSVSSMPPLMFGSFFSKNLSSNTYPRACLLDYERTSRSLQHPVASLVADSSQLLVQQCVESILAASNFPYASMIPGSSSFQFDRLRLLPVGRNLDMTNSKKAMASTAAAIEETTRTSMLPNGQRRWEDSFANDPYTDSAPEVNPINGETHIHDRLENSPREKGGGPGLLLASSEDRGMLNDHLVFLREHIEYFQATMDDISSHTRGRNKSIALGQVGIRCKHCSHVPASDRCKGSTYYPSTLMGIYQAAQNIHVEHLQSDLCPEVPGEVKERFVKNGSSKHVASCTGKAYWADSAMKLGLVDTDGGIRFSGRMCSRPVR